MNWEDAKAFCEWISKKEGRIYRLPTDEEWSVAVGLGRKERRSRSDTPESLSFKVKEYPWGAEWPPPAGVGNFSDQSRKEKAPSDSGDYIEGYNDGFPMTAPVMSFAPNRFGLFDMEGNVRELVEDWYNGTEERRVVRGGSWLNEKVYSSSRLGILPTERVLHQPGFRLVLETQ